MTHLDTHVALSMHATRMRGVPASVRRRLDKDDVAVSPVVQLEIQFLLEIGRIAESGASVSAALVHRFGVVTSTASFVDVVVEACTYTWTRDPFDRLIVATAWVDGATLLTRDDTILEHCRFAAWR